MSRLELYSVLTTKAFVRYKTALHLTKTFVVATLYNCNLLCYVKCSTSLLTFKAVAMSLYQSRETERVYCLATAKLQVLVKACAG